MKLWLPRPMTHHLARLAEEGAPSEICGLLAAHYDDPARVVGMVPCPNRAMEPREAFWIWPTDHYKALQSFADRNWIAVGSYHSHPNRDAEPSGGDCEFMERDFVSLIISVRDHTTRCWRAIDGHTDEVTLGFYTPDVARAA